MSRIRRTQQEIERDFNRIREAAKTATDITEIMSITGLTKQQVQTTLKKHPRIANKIKEQLIANKPLSESIKKEVSVSNSAELSDREIAQPTVGTQESDEATTSNSKKPVKRYVIDASIASAINLNEILNEILESGAKIVMTHITRKELAKVKRFSEDSLSRYGARHILSLCAKNPDKFETVQIDENAKIHDLCIINYCQEHNNNLVLVTADSEMAIEARTVSIETKFLESANSRANSSSNVKSSSSYVSNASKPASTHKPIFNAGISPQSSTTNKFTSTPAVKNESSKAGNVDNPGYGLNTLPIAQFVDNKLVIDEFHDSVRSVCVFSGGNIYCEGPYKPLVGDEVVVASLTADKLVDFKVYKITSNTAVKNNCKIIISKKLYVSKHMAKNFSIKYRSFINNFKFRHSL